MKTLRIGTRTSKLALTQTNWVKKALEKAHPGLTVELVGIQVSADETANTQQSKVPLWQLDGKNFFVKELDDELLAKNVDCTVHSLKDLSVERPAGIITQAVSKRENPRDIAIFRRSVLDKIRNNEPIILGTSSPRRGCNTPGFLEKALPKLGTQKITIDTRPIRGNIDSRLRRLQTEPGDEKYVDGIVLAIAGLNRLYAEPEHQPLLRELLQDALFMVLPLTECPTTPGQGALAIECRNDDDETKQLLSVLHDAHTAAHIHRERTILKEYGGGCHQKFGATSISTKHFPDHILFVKGADKNGQLLDSITWPLANISCNSSEGERWDGTLVRDQASQTDYLSVDPQTVTAEALFIAHSRAVPPSFVETLKNKTLWTSGTASWFRMAEQGLWVQGCTEELGHDILLDAIEHLSLLHLPSAEQWQIVTHDQTHNDWKKEQTIATYTIRNTFSPQAAEDIRKAKHLFWSSASQYEMYKEYVPADCHHYCRAGKTADVLKSYNLSSLTVFPNVTMWRQCLIKAA